MRRVEGTRAYQLCSSFRSPNLRFRSLRLFDSSRLFSFLARVVYWAVSLPSKSAVACKVFRLRACERISFESRSKRFERTLERTQSNRLNRKASRFRLLICLAYWFCCCHNYYDCDSDKFYGYDQTMILATLIVHPFSKSQCCQGEDPFC